MNFERLQRPDYPTMAEVEAADVEQLARWYRHLLPGDEPHQRLVMDRICARFKKLGGMTPELSRRIGHGGKGSNINTWED
jgi:hypothetical protein